MATFTKTITNAVRVFGLNPSNKWGQAVSPYTMTWGVTKWGEGTYPQVFSVQKVASNTATLDSQIEKSASKVIENSFSVSFEAVSEQEATGIWRVVFVSDTTEAENRDFASWTTASSGTASFSCVAAGSTIWS